MPVGVNTKNTFVDTMFNLHDQIYNSSHRASTRLCSEASSSQYDDHLSDRTCVSFQQNIPSTTPVYRLNQSAAGSLGPLTCCMTSDVVSGLLNSNSGYNSV